ncbi:glycosyltransferase family 32 protein [uncultured Bradyrhizobium sp.]|uniref:glycosyltransferase family 32 protein n=1 Tax=uncultured Bradyrhizobium sp. TaxID=199684 RepID=UPI0035CADF9F
MRRAATTAVQLLGNALKIIFFIDFKVRPTKRYRIPAVSAPRREPKNAKKIPRIFWQTNHSADVTLSVYVNYLFNRLLTPTFEHRFVSDDECEEFIRENCSSETYDCYSRLQIGAAKADLWRVLVLLHKGGIYLDIDAAFSWSPESFLSSDHSELFLREGDGRLTNYFMAASPGSTILAGIRDRAVHNIKMNSLKSVFDMTGPSVVDAVAGRAAVEIERSKLVCRQGQFTKKIFQYPDNMRGYWAREQEQKAIVK